MGRPLVTAEAYGYGAFVNTAYAMYDPSAPNPLEPQPPATGPLALTAGWELTAWIQMSDFAPLRITVRKFYGYLARNVADQHRHVLALRGTENDLEWFDDTVCIPAHFSGAPKCGHVALGFDMIYRSMRVVRVPRAGEASAHSTEISGVSFADQVENLLGTLPVADGRARSPKEAGEHHFAVTAHSLGAALATLYTMEHAVKKKADPARKVEIDTLCTFASPRVGMKEFVESFDALPIDSWRIANVLDVVPKLPPSIPVVLPYQHVDTACEFSSETFAKADIGCWHEMDTYLHWLDPNHPLADGCAL